MKEEYDKLAEPNLPEEYDQVEMPKTFFENLYAAEQTNSPLYNIWQGELYENLRAMDADPLEAQKVTQYLNNGQLEEAEELTEDLLEEKK